NLIVNPFIAVRGWRLGGPDNERIDDQIRKGRRGEARSPVEEADGRGDPSRRQGESPSDSRGEQFGVAPQGGASSAQGQERSDEGGEGTVNRAAADLPGPPPPWLHVADLQRSRRRFGAESTASGSL